MRHLRIPGQNIRNLSMFKTQVSSLLREINGFNENDKHEALSYLQSCISNESLDRKSKKNKTIFNEGTKKRYVQCKLCEVKEKSKYGMLKHLQTHEDGPRSCLKCKQTYNGIHAFSWHVDHFCRIKSQVKKFKYRCEQCPREFITKMHFQKHLQGHKRNNCTICCKVFTRKNNLAKHLVECHSVKLEKILHKCTYCEKRYVRKHTLYTHMRQHLPKKFICTDCGEVNDTSDEYNAHKKIHDLKKEFKCPKCGQLFSRRQRYLFHLKRHSLYKCLTCNKSLASRDKTLMHRKQGHQVEGVQPRFICPYCPDAFTRQKILQVHICKKHAEKYSSLLPCKYCDKSFESSSNYFQHCIAVNHEKYIVHLLETCSICEKKFTRKHELKKHMYKVHNQSREQHSCEFCDYKTSNKGNMERHSSLHFKQEFTCEHCGKSCNSLSGLLDHVSYNHVQKHQFMCEICDKSFKRNSELVRHKSIHSEERPHQCNLCEKSYKRFNHLTRHVKKEHQIAPNSRRIQKIDDDTLNSIDSSDSTSQTNTSFTQKNTGNGNPAGKEGQGVIHGKIVRTGRQHVNNFNFNDPVITGQVVENLVVNDKNKPSDSILYLTFSGSTSQSDNGSKKHRLILPKIN